jgi:type IV pilus assembly protein PilA
MNLKKISGNKGFTLIEVLVVVAIIAILAAIVLVAINPAKRFQDARNTQRKANVESVLSAIQQNMVDNKGIFTCASGALPTGTAKIMENAGGYNMAPCLSSYLAVLPFDPSKSGAHWTTATDYDTEYTVIQDATTLQVTIAAPEAANDPTGSSVISVTR